MLCVPIFYFLLPTLFVPIRRDYISLYNPAFVSLIFGVSLVFSSHSFDMLDITDLKAKSVGWYGASGTKYALCELNMRYVN